jgi:hypothetical protein
MQQLTNIQDMDRCQNLFYEKKSFNRISTELKCEARDEIAQS